MRIVFYAPWVYPWMVDLSDVLRGEGHEVTFYATGIFGNYPDWEKLERHCHRVPAIRLMGEIIPHPGVFTKLFRDNPDFLIITNTEGIPSLLMYATARLRGIPTLLLVEKNKDTRYMLPVHVRALSSLKRLLVKLVHKNAGALLAESEAARNYLVQMGCSAGRIEVVMHGVDTKRFRPEEKDIDFARRIGLPEADLQAVAVLYLGGFNSHKGFEYLAEAMLTDVDLQNNVFIIPKYGSLLRDYESRLERCGNVRLIPQASPDEMPRLYSLADIVVHPPVVTAASSPASENVLLEAMACGKPIVATDVGGNSDIVADCGILVPERDAGALGRAIGQLCSHGHLRDTYAKMARRRAEQSLSMQKYAARLLELHRTVDRRRK